MRLHGGAAGLVAVVALLVGGGAAQGAVGDQELGLFVGTTRFVAEDASSYGTTLGVFYGYEFVEDLQWTAAGSFASTAGEKTVDEETYEISTFTQQGQTGLRKYFNRERGSNIIPYLGGGLSMLVYEIDYDYPGSEIGKTSGTGPGAYGEAGVQFRLTRSFTIIPQFGAQVHQIETEDGESRSIGSTGFVLTLRLGR